MRYYGIKTPQKGNIEPYIWWVSDSENTSWMMFFTNFSKEKEYNAHRYPLAEAIRAYEAIGYKCIELEIREKTDAS